VLNVSDVLEEIEIGLHYAFDDEGGSGVEKAAPGEAVSLEPFGIDDVAEVEAIGHINDDTLVLGRLCDDRFFVLWWGHDYTFVWGGARVSNDRDTIEALGLDKYERTALGL